MKDKNAVEVYSTGKMGDSAFADQLLGAVAKASVVKVPAVITGPVVLLDLDKIDTGSVSIPTIDGVKAQINQEAEVSKQWAEAAGGKLAQIDENLEKIRVEIRKIESMSTSALSATAKNMLAQLKDAERKELAKKNQILAVGDDALKQHVEFSRLLEEVRATDPAHVGEVRALIGQVVKIGRYRLASAAEIEVAKKPDSKWPSGTLFFEGKVYFSVVTDALKRGGQKALEAEMRKLVDGAKMSKAATIRERGNADLTGFESGKPGSYYLFSPKRNEADGRKFYEGHALVEVRDVNKGKTEYKDGKKLPRQPFVVVEVKDGIGSLARFVSNRWIPYFWVKEGRIVAKERLAEEEFKRAVSLIWTFRALVKVWKDSQKPVEAPISAEEAASHVTAVSQTDMSTVSVEKVGETKLVTKAKKTAGKKTA